jgi:hypothetical protein
MCAVVLLYIVGAALELAGLFVLARDVFDSARQIRSIQDDPTWENTNLPQPKRQMGGLIELIAVMAAGNLRRRAMGVAFFAAGVIVQTVANLVAL